jgi:hypothetical protein
MDQAMTTPSALIRSLNALGIWGKPRVTWANRPNPAAYPVGREIIVTDLGYATFVNTGTYWRPPSGMLLLDVNNNVGVTVTGTTAEVQTYTYTPPPNLMGLAGMLRTTYQMSFTGAAGTRMPRVRFDGTVISAPTAQASTVGSIQYQALLKNRSVTTQVAPPAATNGAGSSNVNTVSTFSFDTSTSLALTTTVQMGSALDTCVHETIFTELFIP